MVTAPVTIKYINKADEAYVVHMMLLTTLSGCVLLSPEGSLVRYIPYGSGDPAALAALRDGMDHGDVPDEIAGISDITHTDHEGLATSLGCKVVSLAARQERLAAIAGDIPQEASGTIREVAHLLVERRLRTAASSKDLSISQATAAIDELDQTINLFTERLVEWYGIHFPELERLVPDNAAYCAHIAETGWRDDFADERLSRAAADSVGVDVSARDMEAMQSLARVAVELTHMRQSLLAYVEEGAYAVAPNMSAIVGPLIASRLIALAGGLGTLAQKPASTIQVLGAEKALFRHLKTGAKPPKHGIIFQHPAVHNAKQWQRGKVARTLAAELAIAARVDYRSGGMYADELNKKIEERIAAIKKTYPYPPRGKNKPKGKSFPPRRKSR